MLGGCSAVFSLNNVYSPRCHHVYAVLAQPSSIQDTSESDGIDCSHLRIDCSYPRQKSGFDGRVSNSMELELDRVVRNSSIATFFESSVPQEETVVRALVESEVAFSSLHAFQLIDSVRYHFFVANTGVLGAA